LKTTNDNSDVVRLQAKIKRLQAENKSIQSSLKQSNLLGTFQLHPSEMDQTTVQSILLSAHRRVSSLIAFSTTGFYLVDEDSGDFNNSYTSPVENNESLDHEVSTLIENRMFNWAVRRKRPVFCLSGAGEQMLLHVIATRTRVRGLFVAFLEEDECNINEHRLSLLSLVMYNLANAIESYELYLWNKGITSKLQESVAMLTQSKEELQTHRDKLEELVAERTTSLLATNKQLLNEVWERQQAEEALSQAHGQLEQRVQERTAALEQALSQLLLQEKLASIGQLANGVAHELYNPLNFIRTNMSCLEYYFSDIISLCELYDLLHKNCKNSDYLSELSMALENKKEQIKYKHITRDFPKLFTESADGFKRVTQVINTLRDFSDNGNTDRFLLFDLSQAIEDTLALSRNLTEYSCPIETEFSSLPHIYAVPRLIKQALLDILLNAVQAVKSRTHSAGGRVLIRTFFDDTHVTCTIEDNGPGIPKKLQAKIFDPFFTTKAPGQGIGLGLSTAYDIIVHKHEGKLSLQSSVDDGTIISMQLTRTDHDAPENQSFFLDISEN